MLRSGQKAYLLNSDRDEDPDKIHTANKLMTINLTSAKVIKVAVLCIVLFAVYMLGYRNGHFDKGKGGALSVSDDDVIQSTESIVNEQVRDAKLKAIEHMQGFSDAYPVSNGDETDADENTYEAENEQDEDADVNEDELDTGISAESELTHDIAVPPKSIMIKSTSDLTDQELFENYNEYKAAPYITVPSLLEKYKVPFQLPKKNLWWALKSYEDFYRLHPVKTVVPRLKKSIQLTVDEFHNRFRKLAKPVIVNFESLRSLGFKTKNYTLAELKLLFPYDEQTAISEVQNQFVANGIRRDDEELDLGPGLVAIERDEELAKKGKLRSFPRNLKVKKEAIQKLNIQRPPLIKSISDDRRIDPDSMFQLPTIWMGTSSSDTRFHHDCCDNFVMMISGKKRFTLAPTSDWRWLNPQCVGKNKALCWANVANPNAEVLENNKERQVMKYINKIVVDVAPGEILYMPAGWWHHIQNLGPTLMVNWWTKSKETCALLRAKNDPLY